MPELCRFLGIVFYMYFNDHSPAHFHVQYNEFRASVSIEDFSIIDGYLPPRVLGLVIEWAELHQNELTENWNRIKNDGSFTKIEPLV
ncbi:MAG: transcriptional regulator [Spirochaetes bacterium GWF1_51_8]|nr:MAG: transcriptional regulator [Spirochaetes bacterium GWF1_51_8]OHD56167.1 MAG: transcriptional regulator [Spirochaetes bacterium GWF1_51_8]